MLYDLNFLDKNQPWPPPSEKARLKRYEQGRQLYESEHDRVYGQWWRTLRQDLRASLEIVYNFPRRLSNLWADLLIGEPPSYTTENEDATKRLAEFVNAVRFNTAIREVALDMSRYGDGLFKVRLKDGKPHIEAVSPELWFPVVRRGDVRDITHHVIAWTFEQDRRNAVSKIFSVKQRYLVCEIHSAEGVEHRVMQLADGNVIGSQIAEPDFFEDWEENQPHRAGAPLIVHVPNQRTSNRLFGFDDYTDIDGILQEYEVRISQWSRINDHHADPPMAGPRLVPPEVGTEQAGRVAAGEKYFVLDDDTGTVPQYITWDQNVASITAELDRLETMLYTVSETSAAAFGQTRAGASESGTSLKLQMKSERAKAARLRTQLDPAAKEAIRLAFALIGEKMKPRIGWKDGLPEDDKERAAIEAQKRQAGLTSLVSALQRLEDIDEEQALEEIKRIRAEAVSQAEDEPLTNSSLQRSRKLLEGLTGGTD